MGHEFTGHVTETGPDVKSFQKGDLVVSPFTVSCGSCFYCTQGYSSRCEKCQLFGSAVLDGGQAEYVRVPLAESTVMKAPEGIKENALVLMADIFPTGYFAAMNAFKEMSPEQVAQSTVVLIGCGPVALCALMNIVDYKPKHLLAVDSVESRLELAKSLGAEPWNFMTDREGLEKRVKELTEGRGADVVVEVVGLSPALKMGFELLRPWGVISSVGVHNGEVSCVNCLVAVALLLMRRRFRGRETRRMARTCAFRWAVAPFALSSHRRLLSSRRSRTCWASCRIRSCHCPKLWKDMISLIR